MAIPRPVLMVELLMSADRVITAAEAAAIPADPDVDGGRLPSSWATSARSTSRSGCPDSS